MSLALMNTPQRITSPQFFGPYAVRVTDSNDVDAVIKHIKSKELGETESKRNAVYLRDEDLIATQVSQGFFVVLERLAANDHEYSLLGGERAIVAGAGAYPLGVDDTGRQVRIPIQARNGIIHPALMTFEVGSSLYVKAHDLPNENGLRPKGCTYDLIVGLTAFNLFRMAEQHNVEAIVANVQVQLDDVIGRLTGPMLRWTFLQKASPEVKQGSLLTTRNDVGDGQDTNFTSMDKLYFKFTPDNLPFVAQFLHQAISNGGVSYDRGDVENLLIVNFSELPNDLTGLIKFTAGHPQLFRAPMIDGLEPPEPVREFFANKPFSQVRQQTRLYMSQNTLRDPASRVFSRNANSSSSPSDMAQDSSKESANRWLPPSQVLPVRGNHTYRSGGTQRKLVPDT